MAVSSVLFNRGAEKVFGYSHSEVIGEPLDRLMPQQSLTHVSERVQKACPVLAAVNQWSAFDH